MDMELDLNAVPLAQNNHVLINEAPEQEAQIIGNSSEAPPLEDLSSINKIGCSSNSEQGSVFNEPQADEPNGARAS
jgi:hypothetical protein